eukprot:2132423-Rhodomonas_salina.4
MAAAAMKAQQVLCPTAPLRKPYGICPYRTSRSTRITAIAYALSCMAIAEAATMLRACYAVSGTDEGDIPVLGGRASEEGVSVHARSDGEGAGRYRRYAPGTGKAQMFGEHPKSCEMHSERSKKRTTVSEQFVPGG